MTMVESVSRAIAATPLTDADSGISELAMTYAYAIDNEGSLERLGPKLLGALEALGLTPRARALILKGGRDVSADSGLDELRERRRARLHRASTVDEASA